MQILHIRDIILYLSFYFWLTSLNMIISTSICVAANGISFFFIYYLWLSNIPFLSLSLSLTHTHTHSIFFIYSYVNGHLVGFHVLTVANSLAVKIGIQVSFWIRFFCRYMPRNEIVNYTATLCLVFEEPPYCFPWWLYQFTFPPRA